MEKYILIFILTFLLQNIQAKETVDIIVMYQVADEVERTKFCDLEISSGQALIGVCKIWKDSLVQRKKEIVFSSKGKKDFRVRFITDQVEEQYFRITENTKRIEIHLSFSLSKGEEEYLRDFTIKKILFPPTNVKLERLHKAKIGFQPYYRIINSGQQEYHGQSMIMHFYGTLHLQDEKCNWRYHTSGSYCFSTTPGKPLLRGDTTYTYIPNYSPGDEYKIKYPIRHKFSVLLGFERYSGSIPMKLYKEAICRKQIIKLIELEDEFEIEK